MKKEDLEFFKNWFLDYIDQFSSSDTFIQDNIRRKIEHTKRVCEDILLLAKSEKIGEEGTWLAETIALFHDIGRFEQFMRYNTFIDSESEDHARLGEKILEKMGVLDHLPSKERDLILKVVEYHSRLDIPECLKNFNEMIFYLKLIRDADRLDILRIMVEFYNKGEKNRSSVFEHGLPDRLRCSEPIVKDILKNRMAKLEDVKNINDLKLLRLSYIFDFNFPKSIAIIKEQNIVHKIISSMPVTDEVYIINKHLEKYLSEAKTIKSN